MNMTIVNIETLLHVAVDLGPLDDTPAVADSVIRLVNFELIAKMPMANSGGCGYTLTARGGAYLAMLKDTPLPEAREVYGDPRNNAVVGWPVE
jgi:hypothetical protein